MDRKGFIEGQPVGWWTEEFPTFVCITASIQHEKQTLTSKIGITYDAMHLSANPKKLFQHAILAVERGLREQVKYALLALERDLRRTIT